MAELFLVKLPSRGMPLYLTDNKSTLVQVMAWCRQATSHYMSQCWPRSVSPYGVTRPQWVNYMKYPGIIRGMGSANERRHYYVMPSFIGLAHTQNDPCFPYYYMCYFTAHVNKCLNEKFILWQKTAGGQAPQASTSHSLVVTLVHIYTQYPTPQWPPQLAWKVSLTHWGLVTYGNRDLGQHWLR